QTLTDQRVDKHPRRREFPACICFDTGLWGGQHPWRPRCCIEFGTMYLIRYSLCLDLVRSEALMHNSRAAAVPKGDANVKLGSAADAVFAQSHRNGAVRTVQASCQQSGGRMARIKP